LAIMFDQDERWCLVSGSSGMGAETDFQSYLGQAKVCPWKALCTCICHRIYDVRVRWLYGAAKRD